MTPTTHTLLIAVISLCGLEETVLSERAHCIGSHCFVLYQEPQDFPGAQKSCKDSGGQLLEFSLEHVEKLFNSSLSGKYWLLLRSTDRSPEEAAVGPQKCSSISVSRERNFTVMWEPCRGILDGFMCQHVFVDQEMCSGLQAGAQVEFHLGDWNFEFEDSEMYPGGSVAVVGKVGAEYPESRHLCYGDWLRAPWKCEVMKGGCEHGCGNGTCTCPAGKILHPNNITCTDGPCAQNPCTGVGEECQVTQGGFECTCQEDLEKEDGVCVNKTICFDCEHMCGKINGVYQCECMKGFMVSPHDPTLCDLICTGRDCVARCIWIDKKYQCFCPDGYIKDERANDSKPFCTDINECDFNDDCDQTCENLNGSFRCSCNEGFELQDDLYSCVQMDVEDGSGSTTPYPTQPSTPQALAVPSYIKTGSVLGITVFMVLCVGLLFFMIRNMCKRCGKFDLSQFKHPDIDIFYLQQVTTETYKRLSFDKQFKNDSQIL
ncbi:thrombomodulin-like [Centropristis striata]|uniref:thrombomodulin-like n=1 Tax=Centropristis striata TaxID=184440 RepID=UPI0027E15027|nr:thrombomodulin-like [Centropristis striata]